VQFFLIFTIPFTGAFLINYFNIPSQYQVITLASFACVFIIVLFQTIYSSLAHRRMKKEENSFISVTAHQMRTPLTAVKWILQELSRPMDDAARSELVKMGSLASTKLSTIIDDFSEIARIEDGQLDFHYQDVEVVAFAKRAIEEAQPVAKQYGVSLFGQLPIVELVLYGDPVKLEVMFSNLINNAIKYNRKGGTVTVGLRALAHEKAVELTVADTGMGISATDKDQLFKKFFRSEDAKRVNAAGTGLGLYLTRSIVLAHKGDIAVESKLGEGTTFTVTLPLK